MPYQQDDSGAGAAPAPPAARPPASYTRRPSTANTANGVALIRFLCYPAGNRGWLAAAGSRKAAITPGGISMAKMIPAEISLDANRFERDLFEKFKKIPAKWTIFHSFFVGTGGPRPRELDFVILIPTPKSYSVVYLEAKGGRYSIRDRQWFRGGELADPSPPVQARSGMFDLQKQFEARYELFSGRALRLSFSYAVAFTDRDISEVARQADVTKGALLMGGRDVQNGNRMMQLLGEHANEARKNLTGSRNLTVSKGGTSKSMKLPLGS